MEKGFTRIEAQTADAADSIRSVLRALSVEVKDCPRLFTFYRMRPAGVRRAPVFKSHYRMILWCEQPGYWYPWTQAAYNLDVPEDWFINVGSYAALIFKMLQLTIPGSGLPVATSLPADQLKLVMRHLTMMKTVIDDLQVDSKNNVRTGEHDQMVGRLTTADGKALRSVREFLLERDRSRNFGGMRRVLAPSGDFLWVCPEHYVEYDPGLPVIP
jgi:internalin A